MWLEENRANILTDNPDLNEAEVIKEGMSRFRMLSSEERVVRKHSLILGCFLRFFSPTELLGYFRLGSFSLNSTVLHLHGLEF